MFDRDENFLRKLRKVFSDISRGFTTGYFRNKTLYIKHLNHHDQVELDVLRKRFFDEALIRGVPKENEIIEILKNGNIWNQEDEDEIKRLKEEIENVSKQKKYTHLTVQIDHANKIIKEAEKKLSELLSKKANLLGVTAENYSEKKVNESYILNSLFLDKNFEKPFLTQEELDNLSVPEFSKIIHFYNESCEILTEHNIKMLAIQDFFVSYWRLAQNDLYQFFGRPICENSLLQIKLATCAKIYTPILEKIHTIPEEIRNDPDAILDYVNAGEEAKKKIEKNSLKGEGGASTVFGAKKKDYENMGLRQTNSLSSAIKKKQEETGDKKASIGMHELMKMMNM